MQASFDKTVLFYDALARLIFGKSIQKSQTEILSYIPAQTTVLLLGGGTGWLLPHLAHLNIPLRILYLELSVKMLARARQRYAQLPPHQLEVYFRQGTEASLLSDELFEVIFTPFVLDLYPHRTLKTMLPYLHQHLKPGGRWLVTDFYIDPAQPGWQKIWQHGLSKLMYIFFGWLSSLETRTLPDLDMLFSSLPLQLIHTRSFYFNFIRSQVYQNVSLLKPKV